MKIKQKPPERIWRDFQEGESLTDEQVGMFERYADFLLQTNEEYNLTALTDLAGVVRQQFSDSLALCKAIDLTTVKSLADIGTGAGFPGLPLKILYPHLEVKLIEVTKKKQKFLEKVIQMFDLDGVEIVDLDWRTFLRITDYEIDLFVTRAAIADLELIRMFQPSCLYKESTLIYWAADTWEPHKKTEPFIEKKVSYKLAKKDRFLVFMKRQISS